MQRDHVGFGKQRVKVHIVGNGFAALSDAAAVCQNPHAERFGDHSGALPYAAEADYAHGFALKLNYGIVPEAPVGAACPSSLADSLRMMRSMVAYLKQQRDSKLRYGSCAVGRYIRYGNALLPGIFNIDYIVSGSQDAYEADTGACVHDGLAYGGFIRQNNLGISNAPGNLLIIVRRAIVYRKLAKLFQSIP